MRCCSASASRISVSRLADAAQLPDDANRTLRNGQNVLLQRQPLLRRKHPVVRHAHIIFYALALRIGSHLALFLFGPAHFAIQRELSAQDDRLLHKKSLFAAAVGSSTNFIVTVTHRGIRIQPRLQFLRANGWPAIPADGSQEQFEPARLHTPVSPAPATLH